MGELRERTGRPTDRGDSDGSLRCFTLIELLIVVAIIGILAAIAIPNFLNAQVRANIARARGDMQALETALESYALDSNGYPVSMWHNYPLAWRMMPLTSPVAYIATVPMDPFFVKGAYAQDNVTMDSYDYFDEVSSRGGHTYRWTLFGRKWRITSAGPDLRQTWASQPPYDASNGLRSPGDIARIQGVGGDDYSLLFQRYSP